MHNFYIKTNDGSPGMAKYGYVKGNETNLSNRIHDSCEEHPELSTFIYIFKFEKNEKYIYYKEIDKIVSLIGSAPIVCCMVRRKSCGNRFRLLYHVFFPLITR